MPVIGRVEIGSEAIKLLLVGAQGGFIGLTQGPAAALIQASNQPFLTAV